MSSPLSGIPIERRRQFAATLGLFAVLFVAVGIVAMTGRAHGVAIGFSAVSLSVAALLALGAWRVALTVRADLAEQHLDAAIAESIATLGPGQMCGCGHDHDPDELHVSTARHAEVSTARHADMGSADCADDGHGLDCSRDCPSCVLASMRPSPTSSRAARFAE
ncbi:MAG: hypothetical protein M3O28_00710 [Actinomycetota bacterium]|nr:hypothetical protein [Actinomycetota bacterium]